ncbi:MAG: hypothetical protein R3E96_13625 [Planctomycetota bacterium]
MKLVFVTQVYNPDHGVLGFVPRWVQGLAANCEKVLVLALEAGENLELPANVEVHSLGRKGDQPVPEVLWPPAPSVRQGRVRGAAGAHGAALREPRG